MLKDRKNTAVHVAYEDYDAFDPSVPEKNLLRAILVTAMADLKKSGETSRKAMEFFLSTEEDYVFSFQSICNYLSIDPNVILTVTGIKNGPISNNEKFPASHAEEDNQDGSEATADEDPSPIE